MELNLVKKAGYNPLGMLIANDEFLRNGITKKKLQRGLLAALEILSPESLDKRIECIRKAYLD